MKITATRIKEIIREEYRRMNEADGPRVVELDITPKELEGELRSGSGDVPRGEFGEAFAKLLGLELADISEVYLIDSSEFQGLVITKSGEKIHLRLEDQPKIRRDYEDAAVDRSREDRRVARQLKAMETEPDVYESIEESRETLAQLDIMAKGPKGKITARQAKEMGLGPELERRADAAAVRKDFGIDEEAEDAPKDTERVIDDIEDTSKFVDLPKEFTALISYIAKSVAPQVDNAIKAKYFEELARSLRKLDTAEEEIPT